MWFEPERTPTGQADPPAGLNVAAAVQRQDAVDDGQRLPPEGPTPVKPPAVALTFKVTALSPAAGTVPVLRWTARLQRRQANHQVLEAANLQRNEPFTAQPKHVHLLSSIQCWTRGGINE